MNYFINSLNEKTEMVNKYIFDNGINICPDWLINLSKDLLNEKFFNERYFETMFNLFLSLCGYTIENDNDNEIIEKIKNVDIQDIFLHLNDNY